MTSPISSRLSALRAEMKKAGVDGLVVPRADEFLGEYVPACNERLAWITDFTGSAGLAVVLMDKAAFFTDGRYTLQATQQVDATLFEICSTSENQSPTPTMTPSQWVEKNLNGGKLGLYAWAHTPNALADTKKAKGYRSAASASGGSLVPLDKNPLDAAWKDRPAPPLTPAVPHPLEFSGKPSAEKRAELASALQNKGAATLAVMLPEEICWLLNVRGSDVPCTPFTLSYAIAHDNGKVDWFIDPRKISDETRQWVGRDVRIHGLEEFPSQLAALAKTGVRIWIDPADAPVRVQEIVAENGGGIVSAESPIQLMKAQKNAVEIEGTINAHIRDGAAETRFLAAILAPGAAAKLDEIAASDMLEKFRAEGKHFKGLSFDTISGAGGNGAIVHYRASEESKKPLLAGPVYLVDSGGQYLDGTTDITRTVAIDPAKVTPEMKDRFTRVLKGHIQVAMSVFPEGTSGKPLDDKARAALREVGLDYAHGTGHGVGSYLSVHEGPQNISSSTSSMALLPGMIVSNEPGYYKAGEYGIRIENLVLVIDTGRKDTDGKRLFAFRTLTQAPIDRALIEPSLLTAEEKAWLNDYHAGVRGTLTPLLDAKTSEFLKAATAPL
jgi:Xaa-Pro aminopeptidase